MASISRTARFAARTIRPSLRPTFLPARPASFRHVSASTPIQSQTLPSRRYASSGTDSSTAEDPTLARSIELLEQGTSALEQGDLEGAKKFYKQSVDVKSSSGGWFNLGVCEYHLSNQKEAIVAWEKSIEIEPSADAYTNLASAYIMAKPPQPALAIQHLTAALKLAPNDPEIAFNLAAILESTENFEPALKLYEKAEKGGIERAAQNVRSVSAKILAKKAAETKGKSA